jgi:catechol 2,3-dioxygenase-like lactoylglutathione lyase family enzyme
MDAKVRNDARYNVGGVMLPRPFKARRMGHFALWHANLESAKHFYVDLLGLRQTDYIHNGHNEAVAMFTSYGTDHHSFVAIHPSTATGDRKKYYDSGIKVNQVSFQVGTLAEVVDAHAYFVEKQVPISRIGRDYPGSNWAVYAFDPDGHRVELYYGMEQIGWSRRSKPTEAHLPLPYEVPPLPQRSEILEVVTSEKAGADLDSGFRADETLPNDFEVGGVQLPRPFKVSKVGPAGLFVADIDVSERFYVDTLGFVKTEEVIFRGYRCVYLRVGTDHHSIALFPLGLRSELGLDSTTSLLSFGFSLGSFKQLRDAVSFLKERGVRFVDVPPELHPGIDYAVYAVGDDGHLVQLYFQMEQIGWDGKPRPASQRRRPLSPWPEEIDGTADSFVDLTLQGPMA